MATPYYLFQTDLNKINFSFKNHVVCDEGISTCFCESVKVETTWFHKLHKPRGFTTTWFLSFWMKNWFCSSQFGTNNMKDSASFSSSCPTFFRLPMFPQRVLLGEFFIGPGDQLQKMIMIIKPHGIYSLLQLLYCSFKNHVVCEFLIFM